MKKLMVAFLALFFVANIAAGEIQHNTVFENENTLVTTMTENDQVVDVSLMHVPNMPSYDTAIGLKAQIRDGKKYLGMMVAWPEFTAMLQKHPIPMGVLLQGAVAFNDGGMETVILQLRMTEEGIPILIYWEAGKDPKGLRKITVVLGSPAGLLQHEFTVPEEAGFIFDKTSELVVEKTDWEE